MANSGSPTVNTAGKKGPAGAKDASNPDRATPDTVGQLQAQATKQFESVAFDQVRGGAGTTANTMHGGHGDGHGGPSLADKAASRGIREINFAAVKGHGVAKRSAGRKTKPGDIDTLKTAGA